MGHSDNYKHSGMREDRTYRLNGVLYYMDTICSRCNYDLGTHGGSRCLKGGAIHGNFVPLEFPRALSLPRGV